MSRVTYGEFGDPMCNLWLGAAKRAIQGKPGQKMLKELEAALLALPGKRLLDGVWVGAGGVCALGAVDVQRRMANGMCWDHARFTVEQDMAGLWGDMGEDDASIRLGMTRTLAWEIIEKNDDGECQGIRTPEQRWAYVLKWVQDQIN